MGLGGGQPEGCPYTTVMHRRDTIFRVQLSTQYTALSTSLCITGGIALTAFFAIGPDGVLIELDTTDIRTL
jgi:hypothetical protein